MGKQKIDIKDLAVVDFSSDVARSVALNILNRHFKHTPNDQKIEIAKNVLANPEHFRNDPVWSVLALKLMANSLPRESFEVFQLDDARKPFNVFGSKYIDNNAIKQMELAMRLPIAMHGVLMPDAHQGYGLPIGGVLATKNAVIPYGVGMDIGCRMALSILDLPAGYVMQHSYELKKALQEQTHFGNEGELAVRQEHEVLDHSDFQATALLRKLKGKAVKQLGSSGSGNHFVEFGELLLDADNSLGIAPGGYAAILSHSGSRSLGANIAQYYTDIAKQKCRLPKEAQNLAWLDLDSGTGQEYWMSMNLAGVYAKACHDRIHENLCDALGVHAILKIENHHNFAWKEIFDGVELVVHRKGATPALRDQLGIIPGSMTAPGYLVRGLGNDASLNSAAHGAGRKMSRLKAKNEFTISGLKKVLQREKVILIGGSTEEAPNAYKDIDLIMQSQGNLVKTEGKFYPRIVRMAKD